MDIRYYIGIDVSKATLDWAVFDGQAIVLQTQSPNSETGIKAALKLLKALPAFTPQTSVSCCEHTGIYNALILSQLTAACFPIWLESSLQSRQAAYSGANPTRSMLSASLSMPFASGIDCACGNQPANSYKT